MRRALILVLALLAVACVPAEAAKSEGSDALLRAINDARAANGLAALSLVAPLDRAARAHTEDMLRRRYFLHESGPGGEPFNQRLEHYWHPDGHTRAGEVLAWGSGSFASPSSTVRRWLASPAHRAVLLSRTFRYVGIGVARGPFEGASAAVVYTADFGGV